MTKKQYEDEVERLAPSLRRIAYSIVRNEHDAQDAVQQALLAVWARRECVEFARLKPYLTRAVMNACRDIQRARQKAIPMKEMPEMSYQPPDGMLADAVEELRLPLLLHYMEGYKLAEIAGALGQSLPQVTSRLFRARKRLKRMLEEAEA